MKKLILLFSFLVFLSLNTSEAEHFNFLTVGSSPGTELDGLGLGYGTENANYLKKISDSLDCQSTRANIADFGKLNPWGAMVLNIGDLAACSEIKNDVIERFSEQNCKLSISCSDAKMSIDKSSGKNELDFPKFIAEDFVALKLGDEINKMDSMETLRKFAEKKYGKEMASTCKTPFDYDSKMESSSGCNSSVLDAGFNYMQEHCMIMQKYCFNKNGAEGQKDYKIFQASYKASGEKESETQAYFKNRSDTSVNDSLTNDVEMLESLAGIISSQDAKSVKIQNIFNKLAEYKKLGKLDPIFGFNKEDIYSDGRYYKKSIHYAYFDKLLQSNRFDFASAKEAIEKYRQVRTKDLLGSACAETAHFTDICKDATKLSYSHRVEINRYSAPYNIPASKDVERFENFQGIYPAGVHNIDDFKIVMDAKRCKAFNFLAVRYKTKMGGSSVYDDLSSNFNNSGLTGYDRPIASVENYFKSDNLLAYDGVGGNNNVTAPTSSGLIKQSDLTFDKIKSVSGGNLSSYSSDVIKDDSITQIKAPTLIGPTSMASNSNQYNNSFNNLNHNYLDTSASNPNNEVGTAVLPGNNSVSNLSIDLNNKINELNTKLASAEENLKKIKADNEAAIVEKEKQKSLTEENKTISDLKNQISDLKTSAKAQVDNAKSKNNTQPIATEALNSSKSFQPQASISSGESQKAAYAKEQDNSNTGSSSRSVNGQAIENTSTGPVVKSSSTQASGYIGSKDMKSGLILTKIDGLTSEKASEAISNKIMEMGGAPFYIEEDGMIKEIVPILKDGKVTLDEVGKPLFEKIVKGKVGDQKFASTKIQKKGGRSLASITNPADLKHDQEAQLKLERAEYLKLKKITNQALDDK